MSSSRRSSSRWSSIYSTRSVIPPVWRPGPVLVHARVPPPSVSFVVAEPTLGAGATPASAAAAAAASRVSLPLSQPNSPPHSNGNAYPNPNQDASTSTNAERRNSNSDAVIESTSMGSREGQDDARTVCRRSTMDVVSGARSRSDPFINHDHDGGESTMSVPSSSNHTNIHTDTHTHSPTHTKFEERDPARAAIHPASQRAGDVKRQREPQSSWFGSLSRAKGKQRAAELDSQLIAQQRSGSSLPPPPPLSVSNASEPPVTGGGWEERMKGASIETSNTVDVVQDNVVSVAIASSTDVTVSAPTSPVRAVLKETQTIQKRASWFAFARPKSPVLDQSSIVNTQSNEPMQPEPKPGDSLDTAPIQPDPPAPTPAPSEPTSSASAPTTPTPPPRNSWFAALTRPKSPTSSTPVGPPNAADAPQLRPASVFSASPGQPDRPRVTSMTAGAGIIAMSSAETESGDATPSVPPVSLHFVPPTPIEGPDASPAQVQEPPERERVSSEPILTPAKKTSWFSPRASPTKSSPLHSPNSSPSPSRVQHNRPVPRHINNASMSSMGSIDQDSPVAMRGSPPVMTPPEVVSRDSGASVGGDARSGKGDEVGRRMGIGAGQATVRQRVSSLNPSTSRFSLSIPLLGRAKTPLDVSGAQPGATADTGTGESGNAGASGNQDEAQAQASVSVPVSLSREVQGDAVFATSETGVGTGVVGGASVQNAAREPDPGAVVAAVGEATGAVGAASAEAAGSTSGGGSESESGNQGQGPGARAASGWWEYLGWTTGTTSAAVAATATASVSAGADNIRDVDGEEAGTGKRDVPEDVPRDPRASLDAGVGAAVGVGAGLVSGGNLNAKGNGRRNGNVGLGQATTSVATPGPADSATNTNANTNTNGVSVSDPASAPGAARSASGQALGVPERGRDRERGAQSEYERERAPSVASARSEGSAWYAPWTWYSASTASAAVVVVAEDQRESGGEGESEGAGESKADLEVKPKTKTDTGIEGDVPLTDSQRIKADALEAELANPIEATITTNRSGWASFFSSRTLTVKRVEGRPEGGMEVMDLDEDEDMGGGVCAGTGRVGGATGVVSGGASLGTAPPTPPESPDAKTRKTASPAKASAKPAPPLTISDDVKRETARAASASTSTTSSNTANGKARKSVSPAPSAKRSTNASGTSTPLRTPPPPNLVLPTWQDTFHTAPRNVVPAPPPSALARTMRLVSGVLGWADAGKGKGKSEGGGKGKGEGKGGGTGTGRGSGYWSGSGQGSASSGSGGSGKGLTQGSGSDIGRTKALEKEMEEWSKALPRAWDVLEESGRGGSGLGLGAGRSGSSSSSGGGVGSLGEEGDMDVLRGCRRVVVIGIHGWFPGAVMRSVLGEPTGTSAKFVNMMVQALDEFQEQHNVRLEKITKIPLEGDGTIDRRVERLYASLLANQEWMDDLHAADAIFVATHSQGSIVSTHLLDRLIREDHIRTARSLAPAVAVDGTSASELVSRPRPQRVCCLALCGIHLGPLRYLSTSSLLQPYIQYFESTAARELFEFQNTESAVSQAYVKALENVVDHGTKMVYVASLNDQVVPIYSGLFTSVSHPLILRALYIDGDAYHSSDFLSNLLVLLLRILNAGLSDSGLLAHLSEATAGSLNGVGHSTAYEELATFSLAVKYLFLTNDGLEQRSALGVEPFNANSEQNDYEIPWSLRDLIADERVFHLFHREITELRDAFRDWHPKTTILRDVKRKLQPITKLPSSASASTASSGLPSVSKL